MAAPAGAALLHHCVAGAPAKLAFDAQLADASFLVRFEQTIWPTILCVACICRQPAGRLLCAAGSAVDVRNPWWEKNNASNMISIRSVDEFIAELVRRMQAAEGRLPCSDGSVRFLSSLRAVRVPNCSLRRGTSWSWLTSSPNGAGSTVAVSVRVACWHVQQGVTTQAQDLSFPNLMVAWHAQVRQLQGAAPEAVSAGRKTPGHACAEGRVRQQQGPGKGAGCEGAARRACASHGSYGSSHIATRIPSNAHGLSPENHQTITPLRSSPLPRPLPHHAIAELSVAQGFRTTLSVQVLPFFQFYRGAEGRVAAFSASVAKVQRLRDALRQHSSPYCSLGANPVITELSSLLSVDEVWAGACSARRSASHFDISYERATPIAEISCTVLIASC